MGLFDSKEEKILKLQEKIDKNKTNNKIPKTKMGLIKKYIIGSGLYGGAKEGLDQLIKGDLNIKDLIFGSATGPLTLAEDTVSGIRDFREKTKPVKKNMGGMMNARKKNMGLKMADGGEAMKGFSMLPESVQEKMNSVKAKKYNKGGPVKKMGGGMMKYKKGGSVSKSKKPRGTGIAIKGTKFKGVF
tara:strand:+ start:232 stop:792 length:561 start_codon:yes stop_codon:yes gene_type:complete